MSLESEEGVFNRRAVVILWPMMIDGYTMFICIGQCLRQARCSLLSCTVGLHQTGQPGCHTCMYTSPSMQPELRSAAWDPPRRHIKRPDNAAMIGSRAPQCCIIIPSACLSVLE